MNYLNNAITILSLENGQYTIDDIKQVYRKLASLNHPDKGGNTQTMQLINQAYNDCCKYLESHATIDVNIESNTESNANISFDFINELKVMQGVIIEVCGYWLWLTGNTYPYKDLISGMGFKFSGSKKSWYWSPTVTNGYKRGSKSLNNIRKQYGSYVIPNESINKISA